MNPLWVRVNPLIGSSIKIYAPIQKDQIPNGIWSFCISKRKGLEQQDAARMSAAGDGSTEPNIDFASPFRCTKTGIYGLQLIYHLNCWLRCIIEAAQQQVA